MDKNKKLIGMQLRWIYGLSWLVFPFGIVVLAIEHEKMTKEEKQYMISIFVVAAIEMTFSILDEIISPFVQDSEVGCIVVGIIFGLILGFFGVVMLVAAIMCMCEHFWKVPGAYTLAANFLSDSSSSSGTSASSGTEETKKEE